MDKKVFIVIGTRPEAIKMAPVYFSLKKVSGIQVQLVSTGQHRELLDTIFEEFSMKPDFDLRVMRQGQSLSMLTSSILMGLDPIFQEEKPNVVLVHGDTTTSFSAALACFYHKVPVHHVEAGLRSFNMNSPFPEEFHRKAISRLSQRHYAVGPKNLQNLVEENIPEQSIEIAGNTVFESLSRVMSQARPASSRPSQQLLVTLHRREKGEQQFREILKAVRDFKISNPNVKIVYPLHANPKVKMLANEILGGIEGIDLLAPQGYSQFLQILGESQIVLTDSGGIQEEASFLKKKVLIAREASERSDGLGLGRAELVGICPRKIKDALQRAVNGVDEESVPEWSGVQPASKTIARSVLQFLKAQ